MGSAMIIDFIIKYITIIILEIGYLGIFFLMILESALMPVPSEIVMPLSGYLTAENKLDFHIVVFIGTIGNLVGSYIAYLIGIRYGRKFILKYGKYLLISKHDLDIAENFSKKYGSLMVFIGRMLPAIRTVISLPAGIMEIPLMIFIVNTFIGSLIWNYMLTYIGVVLRENWVIVERYTSIIDIFILVAIILFIFIKYKNLFKIRI